jgi:hypothetical protein
LIALALSITAAICGVTAMSTIFPLVFSVLLGLMRICVSRSWPSTTPFTICASLSVRMSIARAHSK